MKEYGRFALRVHQPRCGAGGHPSATQVPYPLAFLPKEEPGTLREWSVSPLPLQYKDLMQLWDER